MLKKFYKDQKGQAIVEMALIAPILLMFLLGIIEFGRLYNAYLIVDHATRAGARIGVVGASDLDIQNKVISLTSSLPNNTTIAVVVSPSISNRVPGQDLTVKADYKFKFIAPLMGNILGDPFLLASTVTMRVE